MVKNVVLSRFNPVNVECWDTKVPCRDIAMLRRIKAQVGDTSTRLKKTALIRMRACAYTVFFFTVMTSNAGVNAKLALRR